MQTNIDAQNQAYSTLKASFVVLDSLNKNLANVEAKKAALQSQTAIVNAAQKTYEVSNLDATILTLKQQVAQWSQKLQTQPYKDALAVVKTAIKDPKNQINCLISSAELQQYESIIER